jgi:hypothetical protein
MASERSDTAPVRRVVQGGPTLRAVLERDCLASEARHLVGRTRAFLLELETTEKEFDVLKDPRAERARAAVAAARSLAEAGSLARLELAGRELLRSLHG